MGVHQYMPKKQSFYNTIPRRVESVHDHRCWGQRKICKNGVSGGAYSCMRLAGIFILVQKASNAKKKVFVARNLKDCYQIYHSDQEKQKKKIKVFLSRL